LACPEIPQSSKVTSEHIAVSSAHLARIHKVVYVFDGVVQFAPIKPALRPALLKPVEVLLSMSEVVALVVIHIGIPLSSAQIIQSPINGRALIVAPISVWTAVAISITSVVRTIIIWTVRLCTACSDNE
jgi:hypothetical protein